MHVKIISLLTIILCFFTTSVFASGYMIEKTRDGLKYTNQDLHVSMTFPQGAALTFERGSFLVEGISQMRQRNSLSVTL